MANEGVWSSREIIPVADADSHEPTLAMIGETVHLLWNCNRVIYHASWTPAGWTQPVKVAIGEQPIVRATSDGRLHCLFVNQFARNYEIYDTWWEGVMWALPVNVSRTYGASKQPDLAVGFDGTFHGTWADTTPGYATIYYATRVSTFWANRPIPTSRGTAPTIGASSDGTIYVAWQEHRSDTDVYDVYCASYCDGKWNPPECISDSAQSNSISPKITIDTEEKVHIVWQEEVDGLYHVFHAQTLANGWSRPVDIAPTTTDCRLSHIVTNPLGYIHAAWCDGNVVGHSIRPVRSSAPWRGIEFAAADCNELSDLDLVVSSARRTYLVWSALDASETRRLFWSRREQFPKYTISFPIVVG